MLYEVMFNFIFVYIKLVSMFTLLSLFLTLDLNHMFDFVHFKNNIKAKHLKH